MEVILPGSLMNLFSIGFNGLPYRTSGSAIRFLIPLFLIAFYDETQLGIYYLAMAFLMTSSSILGLDTGYLFSTKYLDSQEENKKNIFNDFIVGISQIVFPITLILSFAIFIIVFSPYSLPIFLILCPLLIFVEATSFEVGKLFWNTGNVKHASFRDFLKALFLFISIGISGFFYSEIFTGLTISLLIFFNVSLLVYEIYFWGNIKKIKIKNIFLFNKSISSIKLLINDLISTALPQYIQNQITSGLSLIEKVFITSLLGLAVQGSYSFIFSIISITTSLVIIPFIAYTRRIIISDHPYFTNPSIYLSALKISITTIIVTFCISLVGFFVIPYIQFSLNGSYIDNFLILIVAAFFSSVNNSYMATVSPLYGQWSNIIKATIYSLLLAFPYFLFLAMFDQETLPPVIYIFLMIILTSILQILIRIIFFVKSYRLYINKGK